MVKNQCNTVVMENHALVDLEELRQRLDRRNQLLEVIRKAYHRDIIIIREYLLQLQNGTKIEDIKTEDLDLRTIPSIDLRNEGFHLFSPHECELTLKPCYHCGGRLEVTHRESERFMELMKLCEELKQREMDLNSKLEQTHQQIKSQEETNLHDTCEALKEQNSLLTNIVQLQQSLSDRNHLEQLCNKQKEEIDELEKIRHENEVTKETLTRTNLELSNCMASNTEMKEKNEELKVANEDGLNRERELKIRLEGTTNAKEELQKTISLLEALEAQQKNEVKVWKDQMRGQEAKVRELQVEKQNLLTKLKSTVDERDKMVSSLETEKDQLKTDLDKMIQKATHDRFESDQYRQSMDFQLEQHKKEEQDRMVRDEETIHNLDQKLKATQSFVSSHIQELYEECLRQKRILLLVYRSMDDDDNGDNASSKNCATTAKDMIASSFRKHDVVNSINGHNSDEGTTQSIKILMEHLQEDAESSHINWKAELLQRQEQEGDDDGPAAEQHHQRAIYEHLNHQIHLNWESIEEAIQHAKCNKQTLATKAQTDFDAMKESMEQRISLLQSQGREKDEQNNILSNECCQLNTQLEASVEQISELQQETSKCRNAIQDLEQNLVITKESWNGTKDELEQTRTELNTTQSLLSESQTNVQVRDETLRHLESVLKRTTDRYAKLIQENRLRLETSVNVGLQTISTTCDFSQQVDFVKNVSLARSTLTDAMKKDNHHFIQRNHISSIH